MWGSPTASSISASEDYLPPVSFVETLISTLIITPTVLEHCLVNDCCLLQRNTLFC